MIVELGIGALGGGITGLLLMFILRGLRADVGENRETIQAMADKGTTGRQEIYKKLKKQEDCWEDELKEVNALISNTASNVSAILHYLEATADTVAHPGAVKILKDARRRNNS